MVYIKKYFLKKLKDEKRYTMWRISVSQVNIRQSWLQGRILSEIKIVYHNDKKNEFIDRCNNGKCVYIY